MPPRVPMTVGLAVAGAALTSIGGASATFDDARLLGSIIIAVNVMAVVALVLVPGVRPYVVATVATATAFLTVAGLLSFGLALAPGAALWLAALVLALRDVHSPRLAVALGALTVGILGNGLLLVGLVS